MRKILFACLILMLLISTAACEKELSPEEKYEKEAARIINGVEKAFATEIAAETQEKDLAMLKRYYVELNKVIESSLENASKMEVPEKYVDAHVHLIKGLTILLDYYPAKLAHTEMTLVAIDEQKAVEAKKSRGQISNEDFENYVAELIQKQKDRVAVLTNIYNSGTGEIQVFLDMFHSNNSTQASSGLQIQSQEGSGQAQEPAVL